MLIHSLCPARCPSDKLEVLVIDTVFLEATPETHMIVILCVLVVRTLVAVRYRLHCDTLLPLRFTVHCDSCGSRSIRTSGARDIVGKQEGAEVVRVSQDRRVICVAGGAFVGALEL